MVARVPGESDADYELRRRETRLRRIREIRASSSEEEEEAQAAVSAAEPGPAGAVVATAPEPEEKEEEKEVKKERGKEIPPEPKEPPKRKAATKPETSPKPKADPKRTYLQVETRRRTTSPGGTERPAVTLSGSTARGPEPTQTFQVRGLRGQSEVRQGSGPNPSEELELTPRQPSEVPSGSAPWRQSSLKATHGKGFRLRSAQSRQYRNLQGLIRKAKKEGTQVPRSLRKQVKEFGSGRVRTFKRGGTKRTHSESESRHPIRLKSVARPSQPSSSKAKAKPKAKAKSRPLARSFLRGSPQIGLKVHGRALRLNEKIKELAERWASDNPILPYFVESPFQVRKLAASQLKKETGIKGTVAASVIQKLWNSPDVGSTAKGPDEACSSCDDRSNLTPGVAEYLKKKAEAKKAKAKADPAV